MARYVFSINKYKKLYGKKDLKDNLKWIEELKGIVVSNLKFNKWGEARIGYLFVRKKWLTVLDKVNYPKNF